MSEPTTEELRQACEDAIAMCSHGSECPVSRCYLARALLSRLDREAELPDKCPVCGGITGCSNCRLDLAMIQLTEAFQRLIEAERELREYKEWRQAARQFAWSHETTCPRHDADAPCNCGLDSFLSRPRPFVESYKDKLAEAERRLRVAREAPAVKVMRKRQGGIADCACGETVFESMRYCPGCGAPLQWKDSI